MEKRVALNWLLDFYGPLLTEHRRALVRLYCEEDMSLSELAEQTGITRQGVHDAIRNASAQLEDFESKLGLLARYQAILREIGDCRAALDQISPDVGGEALLRAKDALSRIEA